MLRSAKDLSSNGRMMPIINSISEWVQMMVTEVVLPAATNCQTELAEQRRTKKIKEDELILEDLEDVVAPHSSTDGCSSPSDGKGSVGNKSIFELNLQSSGNTSPDTKPDSFWKIQALMTAGSVFNVVVLMFGYLSRCTKAANFILRQESTADIAVLRQQMNNFIMHGTTRPFTKNLTDLVYKVLWNATVWMSGSAQDYGTDTAAEGDLQREFLIDVCTRFTNKAVDILLQSYLKVTYAAESSTFLSDDEEATMDRVCRAVADSVKDRIAANLRNAHGTAKPVQSGPQPSVLPSTFLAEPGRSYHYGVSPDTSRTVTQDRRQSLPVLKEEPKYLHKDARRIRTVALRVIQEISDELIKRLESTCHVDFSKIRDSLVAFLLEKLEDLAGVEVSYTGGRLSAAEYDAVSVIASEAHDRLVMKYWLMEAPEFDQRVVCCMASTVVEAIARYYLIDMNPPRPSPVFDVHTNNDDDTSLESSLPPKVSEKDSFTSVSSLEAWPRSQSALSKFSPSEIEELSVGSELHDNQDRETLTNSKRCRSGGRPGTYLIIRDESAREGSNDLPRTSSSCSTEEKHVDVTSCSDGIKNKTSSPKKKQRVVSRISNFLAKFCCFGCGGHRRVEPEAH